MQKINSVKTGMRQILTNNGEIFKDINNIDSIPFSGRVYD